MYDKRVKIFVIFIAVLLFVWLVRLTQMQLVSGSFYRDKTTKLKLQEGGSRQLKTIRGRILDRNGEVLAADEPEFQLCLSYRLSRFMDERVRRAKLEKAARQDKAALTQADVLEELQRKVDDLELIVDKCVYFGLQKADIEARIRTINDRTWNLRSFLAWVRSGPDPSILAKYNGQIDSVPESEALADFEQKFPDEDERLLRIAGVDYIAEMDKSWPLLELETDDDIFTAQLEFLDIEGVSILPKAHRVYPYGSVAAQTIGWVGPATQKEDLELFEGDKLSRYLSDEVCGRDDGTEYVCETLLRGRRGQVVYDIDQELVDRTDSEFGEDVTLTLDIGLQERIEEYLADCGHNTNCQAPMAAVVIDVSTNDILALVSMPVFDLNHIRQNYGAALGDPNEPLRNRAINKQYPPGSVVKPLILIAGLESRKIAADEVISCPAKKAPAGWPSCWLYNRFSWMCHDDKGPNYARNAVKGSCNIYFSRLANRIEPSVLQGWLYAFGYGREIPLSPAAVRDGKQGRDLRQAAGVISSSKPEGPASFLEQLPILAAGERRYFGIGQGNLRATPLQVANAMAGIARGGLYETPRLFIEDAHETNTESGSVDLNISAATLEVVREGMSAVVNEPEGTAYNEFAPAGFGLQGIEVFGKTGSTEAPDHAWFAGFAEDGAGRAVAVAVVVEGGQHGSSDAGPLARDIIQFCADAGYIGRAEIQM
jgi:penicillin-binding protein 2